MKQARRPNLIDTLFFVRAGFGLEVGANAALGVKKGKKALI